MTVKQYTEARLAEGRSRLNLSVDGRDSFDSVSLADSWSMLSLSEDGRDSVDCVSGWRGADGALTAEVKDGTVDMRQTTKSAPGFNIGSSKSFVAGFEDKDGDMCSEESGSGGVRTQGTFP